MYGTRYVEVLQWAQREPHFSDPLLPDEPWILAQAAYAVHEEMILTLNDFLWRRTKWAHLRDLPEEVVKRIAETIGHYLSWSSQDRDVSDPGVQNGVQKASALMKIGKKVLDKASAYLAKAQRLCVLTGAGISAESGIKTFREAGGSGKTIRLKRLATPEGFAEDPKLVWEFYNARRKAADVAVPNAAHVALARLELGLHRKSKKSGPSNGNGFRAPDA